MEKRQSPIALRNSTTKCKRIKSEYFLTPYNKNPQNKDLNVRLETVKLLEENIGRTLFDINHSNIFLNLGSKAKEIKAKINK